MKVKNVEIISNDDSVSQKEAENYIERFYKKHNDKILKSLELKVEEDNYVGITYNFVTPSFERIRRITGYLVGTMDRWNDAKTIEERDRVKHSLNTI